jgi:transmembrane sensor
MNTQSDTEMNEKEDDRTIDAVAINWYSQFVSGAMSPTDVAALERWLQEDPAHAEAYARLAAIWDEMEPLEKSDTVRAGLREARSLEVGGASHALGRLLPRRWFAAPVALTVFAVFSLVAVMQMLRMNGDDDYRTAVGEQRVIELADGSVITLNTATAVEVDYASEERRIKLLNGQASFDVAHDAERPFIVYAGDGRVRAIGTEFDVYKSSNAVTVTLIEGTVEVASLAHRSFIERAVAQIAPSETLLARAELTTGEQVEIVSQGALSPVAEVEVDRVTAWRDGKVNFRDTPLAEAVTEMNRYSPTKIAIADGALNELRISGVFRTGNSDRFVNALEDFFDVRVERRAGGDVVLLPPV